MSGFPWLRWMCPDCRSALQAKDSSCLWCPPENRCFLQDRTGIWHCLSPEREDLFRRFIREYEVVRESEGRGSSDPAFYRALPFQDLSGNFGDDWRIRARSFRALMTQVAADEQRKSSPLRILDLGTGNCWLSNRLAEAGHELVAVDLLVNPLDGLGAHVHYPSQFAVVQGDFDDLPFAEGQFDLAIFNAAFHYSTNYENTLREACRVLRRGGRVVIMDSPIYHDSGSGRQMVREREESFTKKYGFPSNALPSENFLTYDRLQELVTVIGSGWEFYYPSYGWRLRLRFWKARLLGRREPAHFALIVSEGSRE